MLVNDVQLIESCFSVLTLLEDLEEISAKMSGIVGDSIAFGRASAAKASLTGDFYARTALCEEYLDSTEAKEIPMQTIGIYANAVKKLPKLVETANRLKEDLATNGTKASGELVNLLALFDKVQAHAEFKLEQYRQTCSYYNLFITKDCALQPKLEEAVSNLKSLGQALVLSDVDKILEYAQDVELFLADFIPALKEAMPKENINLAEEAKIETN